MNCRQYQGLPIGNAGHGIGFLHYLREALTETHRAGGEQGVAVLVKMVRRCHRDACEIGSVLQRNVLDLPTFQESTGGIHELFPAQLPTALSPPNTRLRSFRVHNLTLAEP